MNRFLYTENGEYDIFVMMNTHVDLSVVVPLFNEEAMVPLLLEELDAVLQNTRKNYEIVLVDDGSYDNTYRLLERVAQGNSHIKVVRLSRNFGHQAAFNAGIDFARGDVVITMDGDLQHPPSLIPIFLNYAKDGYNLVIGERLKNKQNTKLRELAGNLFYRFMSAVTNLEFKNVSDFALYDRSVVEVLKRLPEKERYLRGMVQWVGFKKKYIPYEVDDRKAGSPKYTVKKLVALVLSGLTSFSGFPLRLAFWLGLLVFCASIIFGGYVVVDHYVNPNPLIAGWATVVILLLFLGSIQLMVMGIFGEYMYKMFNEIKGRPMYVVSETKNIDHIETVPTPYGIHKV